MKPDFDETTFYAESTFGRRGKNQSDFLPTTFGQVPQPRPAMRGGRILAGLFMLCVGMFALNAAADTHTGWLIVRVLVGLGLLLTGVFWVVGPVVAAMFHRPE
jgi:hypothetical protein